MSNNYHIVDGSQPIVKLVISPSMVLMIPDETAQPPGLLIQALTVPPWAPHVSGMVMQAADRLPSSRYCCRVCMIHLYCSS